MNFLHFLHSNTIFYKQRRGISQVFGSLLLLAIVVPIGTVILVNGTTEINAFNNELSNSLEFKNDGIQEELVFEHIRFDPGSTEVMVSIRNAGTVETTIDRITIVNMTSQELIYKITDLSSFMSIVIPLKNSTDITITDATPEGGSWGAGNPVDKRYIVSVITMRGNFFHTVAEAYNT